MRQKIAHLMSDKLVKNLGWLSASQIFIRVLRLAVVVVLARKLTTEDYGIIAILFTAVDFAQIFIQKGGIAPKLIQADKESLDELAQSAYWVNWLICIGIFLLQCGAAYPIALFYSNDRLVLPIILLGIPYLFNPFYAVQDALIRRENRLKVSAIATACYALLSNFLLVGAALMDLGIWSVVVSRLGSDVVWAIAYRRNHAWRPHGGMTLRNWRDIVNFSKFPLGIELLNYVRSNIDYLLIGRFFSLEQLGLYFFAFNAGLGISLSAINMVANSVFPYLCEARDSLGGLKKRYDKSLRVVAAIMFPLAIAQTALAPFYVPVVFGEKWVAATPILMMICLSGIPRAFGLVSEQLLIAVGRGMAGLKWNLAFTTLFIAAIWIGAQFTIYTVAAGVLAVHLICLPLFILWATRSTFSKLDASLSS